MACDLGRTIQDTFDKALYARIEMESVRPKGKKFEEAKANEVLAVRARAFHLSDCAECWEHPPKNIGTMH
jgi:hypothetical protein